MYDTWTLAFYTTQVLLKNPIVDLALKIKKFIKNKFSLLLKHEK